MTFRINPQFETVCIVWLNVSFWFIVCKRLKKSRLNLLSRGSHFYEMTAVLLNIEIKFSYWNINVESRSTTPDYNRL